MSLDAAGRTPSVGQPWGHTAYIYSTAAAWWDIVDTTAARHEDYIQKLIVHIGDYRDRTKRELTNLLQYKKIIRYTHNTLSKYCVHFKKEEEDEDVFKFNVRYSDDDGGKYNSSKSFDHVRRCLKQWTIQMSK
jgi:hypothetical protein